MENGMNRRNRLFYIKLVLFCFLIASLPVILLGIFSYAKSSGVVQQNVSKEKALSLNQMRLNVEQVLKIADRSATHFLSSNFLQSALNQPLDPNQFAVFNQIKAELSHLQQLDTGIADITLFSKPGNWLINNSGLYRLDEWPIEPQVMEWMNKPLPTWWVVGGERWLNRNAPPSSCPQYVNLIKKLPLTAYTARGLAVITIPVCHLGTLFSVDPNNESVLIFDEDRKLFVHEGLRQDGLQDELSLAIARLQNPQSGQFDLRAGSQKYIVTYQKSEFNGWIYVSAVTMNQWTIQSREIGWFTFYICTALLLMFALLSWSWSKQLYRPIGSIYRYVVDHVKPGLPREGVDEIQVIGEQLRSLFDTKKRLEGRLQVHLEQLKTFFMVKLFLGGMKQNEIVERMEALGIRADFQRFSVMSLQIGDLEKTRFSDKDRELLLFAINNMVGELLPCDRRLQPILLGSSQITVVTTNKEQDGEFAAELFDFARLMQAKVAEYLGLQVSIGISSPHCRLTDMPRAYEEANVALRARNRAAEQTVVFFGNLGENRVLHDSYPYAAQSELFDAVKLVNREEARRRLHELLQDICANNPNPYDRQFNAIRLLMGLMGLAHSYSVPSIRIERDQQLLFNELFSLDLARDGEDWFWRKLVDPIMADIEEKTEMRHLELAKKLVRIIHDEFDTDLTIESCAARLHYNVSYLSTVFRKQMDISFSGYLMQYRHQMAKKWLVETEMSVKDISGRLRYNNPQNFIRSFRKMEGVTPGKYREEHKPDHDLIVDKHA